MDEGKAAVKHKQPVLFADRQALLAFCDGYWEDGADGFPVYDALQQNQVVNIIVGMNTGSRGRAEPYGMKMKMFEVVQEELDAAAARHAAVLPVTATVSLHAFLNLHALTSLNLHALT